MSPPIPGAGAAAPVSACTAEELNPISLDPFKTFPEIGTIPNHNQKSPLVKTFYAAAGTALAIDEKIGNKNGHLESGEVDKFLQSNPDAASMLGSSCDFMRGIRQFTLNTETLKTEFFKPADLSPLDLNLLRILPYLDLFPEFQSAELSDKKILEEKINASQIPAEFKTKLTSNQTLFFQYYMAKAYLLADVDKDGKFSLQDATAYLQKMGDTQADPQEFVLQAKAFAIPMTEIGFALRKEFNLPDPEGVLDVRTITILAQFAPQFVLANPDLYAFVLQFFPEDPNTKQKVPSPEIQDGIITLDEFRNAPALQTYFSQQHKNPEDVFKSLQTLGSHMHLPISFWPKEIKENFEKMPKEARDSFEQFQGLSLEMQQMDYVIRMMQAESSSKFEQEAHIDHPHKYKDRLFVNLLTYIFSGGKTTYGEHFHETRPAENRKRRDDAVQALIQTVQKNQFKNIDEAIKHMKENGQLAAIEILNAECHLQQWTDISKNLNIVDRNNEILRLSETLREGEYKFWEFPLLPSPRLGSGGWWERAQHAKNWTWKSPEIVHALALDEYIAYESPNNIALKNTPDISLLIKQLPEERQRAFNDLLQKVAQGHEVPATEWQKVLDTPSLSKEGQGELLATIRIELVKAHNLKLLQDPSLKAEINKLPKEKQAEAMQILEHAVGLFFDPKHPMDPEKFKKVVESLGSNVSEAVRKYVADVDVSLEKQVVMGIEQQKLPDSLKHVLYKLMGQMKKLEGEAKLSPALAALFREAQFANPTRAQELFKLAKPSDAEKVEFQGLVQSSKLSRENQLLLMSAFYIQPNSSVAERAEKHFMAMLGDITTDPTLPDPHGVPLEQRYNPAYTGNLHSNIRSTLNQSIGLFAYGAPTLVGGSAGHALSRSIFNYSRMPIEEITGIRRWVVPGRWFNRIGNSGAFGRVAGNPVVGTLTFGALGTVFTVSPYGESLRDFAQQGIKYPYFPWSDLAVMDAPTEGLNLYLDSGVAFQGMDAVLGTARTIGTLELGTRSANFIRRFELGSRLAKSIKPTFPRVSQWLENRSGPMNLSPTGVGNGFRAAGNAFLGKTEAQIMEETLKDASAANMAKPWAADVEGLKSVERIWAKEQYGKSMERIKQKIDLAWGNAQKEVIAANNAGQAGVANPVQGLADTHTLLMDPALPLAQRVTLQAQFNRELQSLAPNMNPNILRGILEESQRAQSLEVLGKVGPFPEFSASTLRQAKKWMEKGGGVGGEEWLARSNRLLQQGAVQYIQLPKMGLHNQKMAKFMLWMMFQEKMDEVSFYTPKSAAGHPTEDPQKIQRENEINRFKFKNRLYPDYPAAIAPGVLIDRSKKSEAPPQQ